MICDFLRDYRHRSGFILTSRIFLLPLIVTVATGLPLAEKIPLHLDVTPSTLLENQPISLTCAGRPGMPLHYMELLDDKKRVVLHQYDEDRTELRGPWLKRAVNRRFDKTARRLTVTFLAKPSDNGIITCRAVVDVYPNDRQDSVAELRLNIQRPPSILGFTLTKLTEHGSLKAPYNRFLEGDSIKSVCRVELGHPEAEVTLKATGKVKQPQERLRIERDDYNYNVSTEQTVVQVSHGDDGKVFHCKAGNEHEDLDRKIRISVLYKVRDLVFPYSNGTTFEVGSSIICSARGNPPPSINVTAIPLNITIRRHAKALHWTKPFTLPVGKSEVTIPHDAPEGEYRILCKASNVIANIPQLQSSRPVVIRVTGWKRSAKTWMIVGIVAAVLLAIILIFLIWKWRENRRPRNRQKRLSVSETSTPIKPQNEETTLCDPEPSKQEVPGASGAEDSRTLPVRQENAYADISDDSSPQKSSERDDLL